MYERSKPLAEYSLFIEIVRRNIAQDRENGFKKAIKECMQNGILKEYLQRKSSEVINMLLAEYDYATDIAVQRAEERETAFAEGIEQGLERGFERGTYQTKCETAKNLIGIGLSIENIAKATGLTIEEIKSL